MIRTLVAAGGWTALSVVTAVVVGAAIGSGRRVSDREVPPLPWSAAGPSLPPQGPARSFPDKAPTVGVGTGWLSEPAIESHPTLAVDDVAPGAQSLGRS